jgi:anti-sigma regulatory factor (Ser/Thr protein kinase)
VIHVTEPDGAARLAAYAAADRENEALLDGLAPWPSEPPDAPVPWLQSLRSGRPVLVPSVDEALAHWLGAGSERRAVADAIGVRSLLSVPLPGPDGTVGSVTFVYAESGRRYVPDDVPLGVEFARRTAPAVENARRFEQEQATAEVLQRSLLPERLPVLGSVQLAARYVPGSEELKIGGDWYDVIPLRGGRVLVAIGDVVGHGVRAAASMGRIRNLLEFCAADSASPAQLLTRLNDYFAAADDADMATLLVGIYEPRSDRLTLASAGHPPPMRRGPDGHVELVEGSRGAPLGALDVSRYPEYHTELPPGSVLVLYTDGLIERRGESLDDGFSRLANALADAPDDLDQLADQVLDRLLEGRNPPDDVALLTLRPAIGANVGEWRFRTVPRELARLRQTLRDWLSRVGIRTNDSAEVIVAANEAAANAVEHAYGLEPSEFTVEGRYDAPLLTIVVRDHGCWRDRGPDVGRGRGLNLMRSLMDEVVVEPGREGTCVTMKRAIKSSL